ncbi:MAG TPA: TonB family protein [Allosphingosinicella sp.]|nr:TonB family protein [Allosphingosinicella sp.]
MYANGFFEQQQRRSPTSFALVVALHAAGLGAVILAGSTQFIQQERDPLVVRNIPILPDPQPIVQDEPVDTPRPERRDTVVTPTRPEGPANDNTATTGQSEPTQPTGPIGERNVEPARDPPRDPPPPVRREAQLDPRYARDLQPPYPAPELRAERDGVVRIRLTIAPNGRVTAVERLSATSEHFWRATQQQALNRWRFRPATLDGRPVQGVKVMTVNFRIQDA